jgi:hypothetical protein
MRYLLIPLLALGLAAPAAAEPGPKPREVKPTFDIPFRLTDTKHVLVRVKLNGKGPFNFIIDTGAPALIMPEALAKKIGAKEKDGWVVLDKLELEGGLSVPDPRGVAVDMFQLKGMNSMGLAGVELHGVIGYNVLARYKIEYDFTDTKLKWTVSGYDAPAPKRITDKGSSQGGLEMMGELMKVLAMFSGIKPNYDVKPRGYLGAELETAGSDLTVKTVLPGGPAEKAGLKAGDRIKTVKGKSVGSPADLLEAMKKLPEGASVKLDVRRGDETKQITVELGKGL